MASKSDKFVCDFEGCLKTFTRTEHLARHKLNHNPSVIYECNWPGCSKTFVRSDLKDRHKKRHEQKLKKQEQLRVLELKSLKNREFKGMSTLSFQVKPTVTDKQSCQTLVMDLNHDTQTYPPGGSIPTSPVLDNWIKGQLDDMILDTDVLNYNILNSNIYTLPKSMNNIYKLLDTNSQSIAANTFDSLIGAIPDLANLSDASALAFDQCINAYWTLFHVQYPFLHQPSFNPNQAPKLLVLTMIMLGAGLLQCSEKPFLNNPEQLADSICVPVRWKLFELRDIEFPAKTWVIQSLLILGYYEKSFTSRTLHERNYLHQPTIIQILRRTPTLGGNPVKPNVIGDDEIWEQWIEFESLKRATLMAFYIDLTHALIFGHLGMLYAYQIQLPMPCDESLWLASESKDGQLKPFLQELRSIVKNKPVQTGVFGKKILFSGLIAIIYQLQQGDLQTTALGWEEGDAWKDYFDYILDYLVVENMEGCCSSDSAATNTAASGYFQDEKCKLPAYHIAHICMRINHYDLVIFAGARLRMNVRAKPIDYEVAASRVNEWAANQKLLVIHAYLYLFELFLTPGRFNCITDPMRERSYLLFIAALTVWAYVFAVDGPEQSTFSQGNVVAELIPEKEDGITYLQRVKDDLATATNSKLHPHVGTASEFHQALNLQSKHLAFVADKKNVVGLLRLVNESISDYQWELAQECVQLFKHCIERSLGKLGIQQ